MTFGMHSSRKEVQNMQYELAGWKLRRDSGAVPAQRPASWRPRRADGADNVQRQPAGDFAFVQCASFFSLFKLLMDWMKPTDIIEGNLLYSEFTSVNAHLIQKYHPIWHIKLTFTVYYRHHHPGWQEYKLFSALCELLELFGLLLSRGSFSSLVECHPTHAMIRFHPNNCEELFVNSCRFLSLSLPPPNTLLYKF